MHNLYPVSGDICSNTRLDGKCIRGYNTETFTSVGTYSQCVQRCLTETRFLCRSVDYGYGSYTCYISLANKIETGLDTSCFAYHYGRCLFNSAGISTILFYVLGNVTVGKVFQCIYCSIRLYKFDRI